MNSLSKGPGFSGISFPNNININNISVNVIFFTKFLENKFKTNNRRHLNYVEVIKV
jgi:hypothetical protein